MEKNFVCPVCGGPCGGLDGLKNCILKHEQEEKEKNKKEIEEQIQSLETRNKELIEEIEANCKKLGKLGVVANVTYTGFKNNCRISTGECRISEPDSSKKAFDIKKDFDATISLNSDELEKRLGTFLSELGGF